MRGVRRKGGTIVALCLPSSCVADISHPRGPDWMGTSELRKWRVPSRWAICTFRNNSEKPTFFTPWMDVTLLQAKFIGCSNAQAKTPHRLLCRCVAEPKSDPNFGPPKPLSLPIYAELRPCSALHSPYEVLDTPPHPRFSCLV